MSRNDKGPFSHYRRVKTPRPAGLAGEEKKRRNSRREEAPRHPPLEVRVSATERERKRRRSEETVAALAHPTWSLRHDPNALALVEAFAAEQPYPLDTFQLESAQHLAEGRSVLVAAPTGTGKTVVAEFGIWLARRDGKRAIYTAPVKALSNQKFRDLRARYGADEVGLLTGDIVENPSARIVVMTTEIYRNMLLEGLRAAHVTPQEEAAGLLAGVDARHGAPCGAEPPGAADVAEMARRARLDEELSSVGCVIFDELHFLNDPQRGPVWEEAIIHSPPHVAFVGLSATVSNASELRRWIEEVHGPIALVYHTARAVPLESYYFLDGKLRLTRDASGQRVERFPNIGGETKLARMRDRTRRYTFEGGPRPRVESVSAAPGPAAALGAAASGAEEEPPERQAPEPGEVLTALREAGLLPCIYFLPGRRAVEEAAERAATHLFTTPEQRAKLVTETREWVRALPPEDQKLEQARKLLYLLPRGLAFHHAGLLPGLKMMVETLFQRGELKAVFATDTLALGINMPARAVVLGSVSKFDGQQMRLMTPNEYQQVTGRAGRRGMDENGAAVMLYSPWDAFEPAFAALTAPLLPVTSAFTVRYNTVLNLWRPGDQGRLRRAVAASLREFQRRGVSVARAARRRPRPGEEHEDVRAAYEPEQEPGAQPAQQLSRAALAELNATIYVLRALNYIGEDDALTARGRLLRAIFHPAGITVCELLLSGALDELSPAELAEVMSWFTFDNDRSLKNTFVMPAQIVQARRATQRVQRFVREFEYDEGLDMSPNMVDSFHSVALTWARGAPLAALLRRIELAEGDLLVTLNQTIDILQQVQGAITQTLGARDVWRATGPDARQRQPALDQARERLEAIVPRIAEGWRMMLRGSVAMSRAIPEMATPLAEEEADALPPLAMAEDEDATEAAAERAAEHAEETPEVSPDGI